MYKDIIRTFWKLVYIFTCLKACLTIYDDMIEIFFKHIYILLNGIFIQYLKTRLHQIDGISKKNKAKIFAMCAQIKCL